MEANKEKMTFLKRIKTAIFKLEDYGIFLGENFKTSLKYFFLLVLILSVVVSLVDSYNMSKMINKGYEYIVNELPDFTYENGNLNFNEKIDAYDHEYSFKLLTDTSEEVSEETLKGYKTEVYNNENGIILLKDKLIYIASGTEMEYSYQEFLSSNGLEFKNKEELIALFAQTGMASIVTAFFTTDLIVVYISNAITIFSDIVVLALFGIIAARFCGLKFKIWPMFSISIYSMTLSILLTAIYSVVYGLTGFVINYFNIMYLLISYVYLIAAILMIKYDLIKQHFELEKIMEVQKQVHEELKEQEEKEKEENKEENKEDSKEDKTDTESEKKEENEEPKEKSEGPDVNNREPDGSEI